VIAEDARAGRLDWSLLGPVSAGHFCTDLCQGALPALLPFLIVQRGLSLAAATALITAATIGSSVIQPLFGIWSDRLTRPGLMPLGVALAATGIGLAGLFRSYPMIVVSIAVMGLGVAAFHPEAARVANAVSAARAGAGMSYFAVGGNLGYAVGPLITVPIVLALGLDGTPLIAVPGLLATAIIVRRLPLLRRHLVSTELTETEVERQRADAWFPFARLVGIAVLRTVPFFTLQALVPIYFVRHFHAGAALGGAALTLMLLGGAAGTLIGGRCADLYGRQAVIVGAMMPLTLLLFTLRFAGVAEFVVLLVGVGLVLEGPFSTTVLMGQEYLPAHVGLASGVTYGLAIGVGGMIASALGALAGGTGIAFVIELLPGFTFLSLVLALSLPDAAQPALRTREAIRSRSDARRARRS
jgi:FSR family fosmidomycin resistance protein-like MFS transporter